MECQGSLRVCKTIVTILGSSISVQSISSHSCFAKIYFNISQLLTGNLSVYSSSSAVISVGNVYVSSGLMNDFLFASHHSRLFDAF